MLSLTLRIPDSYDAKIAKIFKSSYNSANKPSFQNRTKHCRKPFCPMLHRCKKCGNILKVASVGRGEVAKSL